MSDEETKPEEIDPDDTRVVLTPVLKEELARWEGVNRILDERGD